MIQLTSEQAIAYGESGEWKNLDDRTLAIFQLQQDCLCIPFDRFHEAVERAAGRPVWTHEFALNRDGLLAEIMGDKPAPTLAEIFGLIPPEKLMVVAVGKEEAAT